MLCNYNASQKVTAHETKEEMSNISKESGDMTLSNSSSADDKADKPDDENERIKEGLKKIFKEMKEPNRELEEKLMRECEIYCQSSLMRK